MAFMTCILWFQRMKQHPGKKGGRTGGKTSFLGIVRGGEERALETDET